MLTFSTVGNRNPKIATRVLIPINMHRGYKIFRTILQIQVDYLLYANTLYQFGKNFTTTSVLKIKRL